MATHESPGRPPGLHYGGGVPGHTEAGQSAAPFLRLTLVAALALSVAMLVGALSARQVSQRDNAMPLLEASVRTLTDPDRLVAAELPSLRAEAEDKPGGGITVPGFPLDVALSADEARTASADEIADLLVERGAVLVYGQGVASFDRTGNQDTGLLSAQGVVKRLSGRLTGDAHSTASTAAAIALALTAALAVAVVLTYDGERRLRALGIGVLIGGGVGALASGLLAFATSHVGGHDPFASDVRDIVQTVLDVPQRNYTVVAILGIAITGISFLLRQTDARAPSVASLEPTPPESNDLAGEGAAAEGDNPDAEP